MFWIFMLTMNLLIPLIMLMFGSSFQKNSPKTINGVYGYRTKMSMLNIDTWKYAHNLCGKLWVKLGWLLILMTILGMLPFVNHDPNIVGKESLVIIFLQLITMLSSIYFVEKGLRKSFDKAGKRIE